MSSLLFKDVRVRREAFSVVVDRLEVRPAEIVGLVGRSGSGKSTLLEALAGFLPLDRGSITLGETHLENLPVEKRKVSLVFQRSALFPHLSLAGNVEFGLALQRQPRDARRKLALEWLERVGLGGMGERRPGEISEGQAQRVALARALVVGFPVLALDEPFSALDPETRSELYGLLGGLVRQTQVCAVLVTHQAEDILALADTVYEQVKGTIAWSGTRQEWSARRN